MVIVFFHLFKSNIYSKIVEVCRKVGPKIGSGRPEPEELRLKLIEK